MYDTQVLDRLGGDKVKAQEYMKKHPFDGVGACPFEAKAQRPGSKHKAAVDGSPPRQRPVNVSAASVWVHSTACSSVGKVCATALLKNPAFVREINKHGRKTTAKVMAATAQELGLGGGASVRQASLYKAQATMRKTHNVLHQQKFDALPAYLAKVRAANPGSVIDLTMDAQGRFSRMFIMLKPVVDAVCLAARPVSGSDMGHLKHPMMIGVCASGYFKFGSGKEITLWLAFFSSDPPCEENTEKWEYCADMIIAGGAADLYNTDHTHITDRMKGINHFDMKFPGMNKAICSGHLLENTRFICRPLGEHFHTGMFWRVQGSATREEAAANLLLFKEPFPSAFKYLSNVDPKM